MPTVDLIRGASNAYTSEVPLVSEINDMVAEVGSVNGALSEVNGLLDIDNLGFVTLSRDLIRRRAVTEGRAVGSTLNYDTFKEHFSEVDLTDLEVVKGAAEPIPGASTTYRVKHGSYSTLRLFWNVTFEIDEGHYVERYLAQERLVDKNGVVVPPEETKDAWDLTWVGLFVDGVHVEGVFRQIRGGVYRVPVHEDADKEYSTRADATDVRVWSGTLVLGKVRNPEVFSKGWHNVSLRMASPSKQVRVKARSIGYLLVR